MLNQPLDENIGIAEQSEKKETNPTLHTTDFSWCFLLNCCFLLVV
jgi:hypothetical protein